MRLRRPHFNHYKDHLPPAFGVICSFAASCNLCETFSFHCRARPSVSRMATVVLACGSRAFACYCVTGLALLSDSDGGGRKELEHACRCHARPRFPLVGICGGTATCNRRLRLPSLAGRKKFVNPARLETLAISLFPPLMVHITTGVTDWHCHSGTVVTDQ